jgi:DNA-binding response OmpR family regulator
MAARHPPDLVILDLGLPDLDGVELIGALRGWTSAPIIVLSGRTDSSDKVEALDAGADDYVTKPFGVEELLARMRAAARRTTGGRGRPGSSWAMWSSTWPPSGSSGRAPAPQARARSGAAPLADHGAGDGVPLPAEPGRGALTALTRPKLRLVRR